MPRRRKQGTRAPNGASTIYYSEYDDRWHGRVTVGVRDNGKPDRRHVKRKTEAEVSRAVQKLEQERNTGNMRKPGGAWTVEQWLTHWVENIAALTVRYKPLNAYRTAVYQHLIPGLGAHRIDRVEPEHFEKAVRQNAGNGAQCRHGASGTPNGPDGIRRGAAARTHHTKPGHAG